MRTPPFYMQVSRDGVVLHLSEHHGDATPGATAFVQATGLAGYHRELGGTGYRYLRPGLERIPRGSLGLTVLDPFGNRLRFDEALPPEPPAVDSREAAR
jgi:hypothetical protein